MKKVNHGYKNIYWKPCLFQGSFKIKDHKFREKKKKVGDKHQPLISFPTNLLKVDNLIVNNNNIINTQNLLVSHESKWECLIIKKNKKETRNYIYIFIYNFIK